MFDLEWQRVLDRIDGGPMPFVTVRVFTRAVSNLEWNTGQVKLTREQLAELCGTTPGNVSRAMKLLEDYGAVNRRPTGRGVAYVVNPAVEWKGDDKSQRAALRVFLDEAHARLVNEGKLPPVAREQPTLELVGKVGP